MIKLYAHYEETCARSGVVDFAELLLRAFELWRDNAGAAAITTGGASATCWWTSSRTPTPSSTRGCADARSSEPPGSAATRSWSATTTSRSTAGAARASRTCTSSGATIPQAQLFRLEQNYRSTAAILEAANALIANNTGRLGKTLWTSGARGEPIQLYAAFNERDEAEFVTHRIREWSPRGGLRREMAILYRSNAQSRVFEEAFISARVPYRVYGGLRFFERAEIKDALAYLRLIANRDDDASFERVVNLPTRGIGAKSVDAMREDARGAGSSLWEAARRCDHRRHARRARPRPPCSASCS